jgi:hypothetical protein
MTFCKNCGCKHDYTETIIGFKPPKKNDDTIIKAVGPTNDLGEPANPAPIAFVYIGKSRIEQKPMYRVLGTIPIDSTLQAEFNKLTGTTETIEFIKPI